MWRRFRRVSKGDFFVLFSRLTPFDFLPFVKHPGRIREKNYGEGEPPTIPKTSYGTASGKSTYLRDENRIAGVFLSFRLGLNSVYPRLSCGSFRPKNEAAPFHAVIGPPVEAGPHDESLPYPAFEKLACYRVEYDVFFLRNEWFTSGIQGRI